MEPSECSYSLRTATFEDLSFVTALHHETLKEYIEPIWGWEQTRWDTFVRNWFKPHRVKIVQENGADIGILVVEDRQGEIYFESISVAHRSQGKGLGSRVIRDVLEDAARRKLPVRLDVLKTNTRAKKLYESFGFKVTGTTETHFAMKR